MQQTLFLLFLSTLVLSAQESGPSLLEKCDFSQGLSGWHGDGTVSSGSTNPLAPPTTPTLDLNLSSSHWCKIMQDFNTKYPTLNVTIQYKLTPEAHFSAQAADYVNITHAIGYDGWVPINIKKGYWSLLVSDFSRYLIYYSDYQPKFGADQVQTIHYKLDKIDTQGTQKTLTLAFPPGQGTVSFLSIVATP